MLLDDLVTAIQTVQTRIREHGASLSQNEYRTRIALIDPVLNALGWDVSNPRFVTIEDHHSGVGTPDYALLGEDGKPRAYIEAKKFGEMAGNTKSAHTSQLLGYADQFKTNYAGLTDGDHWVFRDFSGGLGDESYILDLTISTQSAYQYAPKFLALWRPNLKEGQLIEPNQPILVPTPVIKPPPPPPPSSEWISLANYKSSVGKPSVIRLPNGQEKRLGYWYDILGETAKWLIEDGKITNAMCPIKDIVSSDLHSEGGARFEHYGELPNGLFFNKGKMRSKALLLSTEVLVKHCGQDPASILLKPSQ